MEDRRASSALQKSYVTILEQEIAEGMDEIERPAAGLLMSGLSAGLDVGFSVLALGVASSVGPGGMSKSLFELVLASAYAVGFVLVVFGRSELFTEHTTLAFLPVLGGKASLRQLVRLWGLVFVANITGAALFALLLSHLGPALGVVRPEVLGEMAHEVVDHPAWVILLSAVVAGWLMGLASWLVTAGRDTTSQVLFVWLVTGLIGYAGLHHSILGSVEVLSAIFAEQSLGWLDFARFVGLAAIGNAVGGVVFVGIVKYGHASVVRPGMRNPANWDRDRE